MNKFLFLFLFFSAFTGFSQSAAPATYLSAIDPDSGDILVRTVRSTITAKATYYSTMNWNAGGEGGAYCGFQDSPDQGRLFIYSIWDPSNKIPIGVVYQGKGTKVEKFGGEGTGLKSMNSSIGWDINEWNTVATRRWDVNGHTYFGFWVKRGSQNKWYHMVTMDYPVANVTFNGNTSAFLEDWLSTGSQPRRFEIKDVFKRKLDGTWYSMNKANLSRVIEDKPTRYGNALDGGVQNGVFFMQTGGNTTPSYSGNLPLPFEANSPSTPPHPAIDFFFSAASPTLVSWYVPEYATPQFKYTVKINGNLVTTSIGPNIYKANIKANVGDEIEVTLEDILGKTTTKTTTIGVGNNTDIRIPHGVYKLAFENSNKVLNANSNKSGDKVSLNDYNGSSNQKWEVGYLDNGEYQIKQISSNNCVDAFGTQSSSSVGIYNCHGGASQKWKIINLYGNTFKVINVAGSKAMDAFGAYNGAGVGIYEFHGNSNQRIQFIPISSSARNTLDFTTQDDSRSIKIYPNPTSSILYVEVPEGNGFSQNVELVNSQGVKIMSKTINSKNEKIEFNVSNLPKGLYIVNVGENQHKVMIK